MAEDTLLDILCHLLELFWTHVHNHQWPILSPRLLYQAIKARECPHFLCLAICAASHRFSSHPALRGSPGSTSLAETFVTLARQQLYQLQNLEVARIQSLCILILYEAAVGRGSQAWADNGNCALCFTLDRNSLSSLLSFCTSSSGRHDKSSQQWRG